VRLPSRHDLSPTLGSSFDNNIAADVIFNDRAPPVGWPLAHILENLNNMTRETVESFFPCFAA
jgi:hypothetical protein